MKFKIDCKIEVGSSTLAPEALAEQVAEHGDALKDISSLEGELVLSFDGEAYERMSYSDPILRLAGVWLRKVPWVISGDTETVALRNSEHCFAFVPAGNAVEISFFQGDEAGIEEYVLEPTNVRLDDFAEESIRLGKAMVALVRAVDASLLDTNEDCKDLVASLDEATTAWHDYQVHQRR